MNRPKRSARQSGAAAVEFALVFPVVFLLLYGLVTFGAVLYTQMAVARAVSDGARAVPLLLPVPDSTTQIKAEIVESLAASAVVPRAVGASLGDRREWLNQKLVVTFTEAPCAGGVPGDCATVTLRFPYGPDDGTRLFPSITIPGLGETTWIPSSLFSAATVRL